MEQSQTNRILIIAAESSAAIYAAQLMDHWQESGRSVSTFGIGDEKMVSKGFRAVGRAEELAVVGFWEILKNYSRIKSCFDEIVKELDENLPEAAILIDFPGFNLRLAKELKERSIPVIYYVSPQLWAWKQGRVKKVKAFVDRMLVLFPFEVDFYKKHGVDAEYVGHPLLEPLKSAESPEIDRQTDRGRFGFQSNDFVLGLLPGSRRGEIDRHLDTHLEVAKEMHKVYGQMKFAICVAPTLDKEDIQSRLGDIRIPYTLVKKEPFEMIRMLDAALVTSGTATLQVGLMKVPMVIIYKMHWLTAILARLLVRGTKFFGLVNIIAGREIVPEKFQSQASPSELVPLLRKIKDDGSYAEQMRTDLTVMREQMGDHAPTKKVAAVVEEYLDGK